MLLCSNEPSAHPEVCSALGLVEGPEGCGPLPVGLLVVGHELDTRLVPRLNVGEAGQLHPAHVARGPGYRRGYIVSVSVWVFHRNCCCVACYFSSFQ